MFEPIIHLSTKENVSILTMDAIVAWKKSNHHYNFESLPKTAILTAFTRKKKLFSNLKKKKIKGIKGENFLIDNNFVLCTACAYGASHIINLCEELKALGVSQFIFIGLAGRLNKQLNEGELLYVNRVYSGIGTSYYYGEKETISPKNEDIHTTISKQITISNITGWSTDAPFRETMALKKYYQQKGAEIVEMESAAIYAFANFYNLKAACYIITSDILTNDWQPPKNFSKLSQKEHQLIDKIKQALWNR